MSSATITKMFGRCWQNNAVTKKNGISSTVWTTFKPKHLMHVLLCEVTEFPRATAAFYAGLLFLGLTQTENCCGRCGANGILRVFKIGNDLRTHGSIAASRERIQSRHTNNPAFVRGGIH